MMMMSLLSLLIFAQAAPSTVAAPVGPQPIRVRPAIVAAFPVRFIGLRLELCGMRAKTYGGIDVLNDPGPGVEVPGVHIRDGVRFERKEGAADCCVGIWRHVRGKTFEEVVREDQSVLSHGYDPDYALFPQ